MVVVVVVVAFGLLKESLLKVFPRIPYLNLSSKASWPNRDFFFFFFENGGFGGVHLASSSTGYVPGACARGMFQGHVAGTCARGMWQRHVPVTCARGMTLLKGFA